MSTPTIRSFSTFSGLSLLFTGTSQDANLTTIETANMRDNAFMVKNVVVTERKFVCLCKIIGSLNFYLVDCYFVLVTILLYNFIIISQIKTTDSYDNHKVKWMFYVARKLIIIMKYQMITPAKEIRVFLAPQYHSKGSTLCLMSSSTGRCIKRGSQIICNAISNATLIATFSAVNTRIGLSTNT